MFWGRTLTQLYSSQVDKLGQVCQYCQLLSHGDSPLENDCKLLPSISAYSTLSGKNTVLAEDRMVESTKTEEGYARPTGQTTLWSTPQALMRSHVTYTLTSFETQVGAVVS